MNNKKRVLKHNVLEDSIQKMRIFKHPILGDLKETKTISIMVDGEKIEAIEGEPIAAALTAAGIKVFHRSPKKNEPRGYYCAIGVCSDCFMIVNGHSNVRTCVTPVEDGMIIETQRGKFGGRG